MRAKARQKTSPGKTDRVRDKRRRTVLHDGPRGTDIEVGQRVRLARTLSGLSQTELARAIGLTFQQLQKYERGANRVSASKLWQISQVLGVQVQWFFAESVDADRATRTGVPLKRETLELVRSFAAAPPDVRVNFLQLVQALVQQK